MLEALIHGVVLAFGLILPLGVQNVFVFNQGASQSSLIKAIPVVITASICDTLLILLAVLGISLVLLTFPILKVLLFSIGFFFLLYMGWQIWNTKHQKEDGKEGTVLSMRKQIGFAASVSLLNPHAIMDTIGVIGTNSLSYTGDAKVAFTIAAIVVSWIWFLGLAIAGKLVGRLDQTGSLMSIINKISALIIWSVGIYMGWRLL